MCTVTKRKIYFLFLISFLLSVLLIVLELSDIFLKNSEDVINLKTLSPLSLPDEREETSQVDTTKCDGVPEKSMKEDSVQKQLYHFRRRLDNDQKESMLQLLNIFTKQLESYNITYMAYGGTLIGVYRHHGMIPWDDDIDILVDGKQKHSLLFAMQKLNRTHGFYEHESPTIKYKFFKLDSKSIEGFDYNYPFIDIFSMMSISPEQVIVEGEDNSTMDISDIYPLIKREFNGLKLYSPCNMLEVLKNTYSSFGDCTSPFYSHELEEGLDEEEITVDCKILQDHFPFVKRFVKKGRKGWFIREELLRNETVIQVVRYSMPHHCSAYRSFYPSNLQRLVLNN